jgi:hypothetical protein
LFGAAVGAECPKDASKIAIGNTADSGGGFSWSIGFSLFSSTRFWLKSVEMYIESLVAVVGLG